MIEQTGVQVGATAAESARHTRAVLDEIGDPDDELTVSAATRHRVEGTTLALEWRNIWAE
ncbi:MAG: hypothetical protein ACR2GH_17665 [Pseudonocardia sp.]